MPAKRTVAIGILGSKLDRVGKGSQRWNKWRPTLSLCQQPDLLIHRLELIHGEARWDTDLALKVVADIAQVSPETEVRLHPMALQNPWDFEEVYASLHDFAAGYPFDTASEDYLVHITTGTHVQQIVWFLLAESRHIPAKLIQTQPSGAREDDSAPAGRHVVTDLDLQRYDQIAKRFQAERLQGTELLKSGIATRNSAFNRTIEQIERVAARSRAPILISGPTGAGKSFLARQIYELKRGRHQVDGAFVEVNCATLRGDTAMSTLFGHTKGAFTGAQQAREGLLRSAHKGVLFLDEIGELPLDEQAMLLKAIEEKRFLPMGSDKVSTKASSARTSSPGSTSGHSSCLAWPTAARTSNQTSISSCSDMPGTTATGFASVPKPGAGICRSPRVGMRTGPETSGSSQRQSRAWRPWRIAAASTWCLWRTSWRDCARTGDCRQPPIHCPSTWLTPDLR
jgi:transcriptional regulatory protein RtcR